MQQLSNRGVRSPCEVRRDRFRMARSHFRARLNMNTSAAPPCAQQNIAGVKRVVDQLQVMSRTSQGQQRGFNAKYVSF